MCRQVSCRPVIRFGVAEKHRHRVPRDGALRTAWLERIGHPATYVGDLIVCGRHFAPDDYYVDPRLLASMKCDLIPRLRRTAVPTLYLPKTPVHHAPVATEPGASPAAAMSYNCDKASRCTTSTQTSDSLPAVQSVAVQTAVMQREIGTQTLQQLSGTCVEHLVSHRCSTPFREPEIESSRDEPPEAPGDENYQPSQNSFADMDARTSEILGLKQKATA
ncbi:hypothetical protein HPB52_009581 [Rhipicephalus sanguineus]|uniref:THAP-type domain-containing protein n=1 Tax=Rhipicephalus sanguineus TaxID=34632 RepID=A0A9D4T1M5_RHISA|nr:hypothetical protein HPB52_009581 [Rhipicephalus sanguineus]